MKRLENGLVEGVEYCRDESGRINWFKMIPPDCLYINQEKRSTIEKRLNKPFSEIQKSEVSDTELVINLQGIRYLADLRGYKSSNIKLDIATPEYAAATCVIEFTPHDNEIGQSYSACASAHRGNTKSWYANYLVEAASNRAFCRAVRFYLKINTVSQDELGSSFQQVEEEAVFNPFSPNAILKDKMKKHKIGFDRVLLKLKEAGEDVSEIRDVDCIPKQLVWGLLEKIDEKFKG